MVTCICVVWVHVHGFLGSDVVPLVFLLEDASSRTQHIYSIVAFVLISVRHNQKIGVFSHDAIVDDLVPPLRLPHKRAS